MDNDGNPVNTNEDKYEVNLVDNKGNLGEEDEDDFKEDKN